MIQVDGINDEISVLRSTGSTSAIKNVQKRLLHKKSSFTDIVLQVDGANDSSSEEDLDEDDDDDDDEDFDNYPIAPVAGGNSIGDGDVLDEEVCFLI